MTIEEILDKMTDMRNKEKTLRKQGNNAEADKVLNEYRELVKATSQQRLAYLVSH